MYKLTIHRTTGHPFFKKETPALPPAVKGQAGALPIPAYPRTAANALLNNVHPNQWKLYRQQCRPPPFPAMYGLFLNTKRKDDLAERSKTVRLR